ncbi:hypothetical protein [Citrobacter amalonaticus]|uniref:hypothetical protein n=1 Tax=Citrobacter amalonaticus TaxID=35703 RepID=UPI00333D668D
MGKYNIDLPTQEYYARPNARVLQIWGNLHFFPPCAAFFILPAQFLLVSADTYSLAKQRRLRHEFTDEPAVVGCDFASGADRLAIAASG